MKKIILILALICISFSPTSFAYDLNSSEKIKVEDAADAIN